MQRNLEQKYFVRNRKSSFLKIKMFIKYSNLTIYPIYAKISMLNKKCLEPKYVDI